MECYDISSQKPPGRAVGFLIIVCISVWLVWLEWTDLAIRCFLHSCSCVCVCVRGEEILLVKGQTVVCVSAWGWWVTTNPILLLKRFRFYIQQRFQPSWHLLLYLDPFKQWNMKVYYYFFNRKSADVKHFCAHKPEYAETWPKILMFSSLINGRTNGVHLFVWK